MLRVTAILALCVPLSCGPGDKDSATGGSTTGITESSGSSAGTEPTTGAATGTGASATDDPTTGAEIDCSSNPQVFPAFDKTCATVDDCVIVFHTDCCGPLALGITRGQEEAFAAAEATCSGQCPPLGCDHQTIAEDGDVAPQDSDIQVECAADQCMTFVP
jgi:hypothetical protein